jgi:hypothetical protein
MPHYLIQCLLNTHFLFSFKPNENIITAHLLWYAYKRTDASIEAELSRCVLADDTVYVSLWYTFLLQFILAPDNRAREIKRRWLIQHNSHLNIMFQFWWKQTTSETDTQTEG